MDNEETTELINSKIQDIKTGIARIKSGGCIAILTKDMEKIQSDIREFISFIIDENRGEKS